ncbi:heparinase II/III family protein [Paenibacillus sp. HW567]|uniref:heparinase II/III family protein n=1 Tax=Paenibacillus sp. HW567 TaxID=1034769 RepID=UPI00035CE3D6|nr:heparinase II/III family protein [Paenibacillus sp. HW567]
MERSELLAAVRNMAEADERLYYPEGDSKRFWSGVRQLAAYAEEVAEIRGEGARLKGTAIPGLTYELFSIYSRTGSRLEYEGVYFERRRILNTAVLLSLLEPEQESHVSAVCEIVWSICGENTWCLPAHVGESGISETIDLFSAETGFALSEIRCLLGDRLPALLQARIQEEVHKRLFVPYLTSGPYHWETATHNWAAVCSGSMGSAALLLIKDPEVLTDILIKVQDTMEYYLRGFGEDGACLEGLGYWNYGFGYFVYYADLLRRRSKGALDWFGRDKVGSIASFQQKCFLGGDLVANFSDSQQNGSVFLGLSHYLAVAYPEVEPPPASLRAAYTDDHCSRWAPALRNLLWRCPEAGSSEWGSASSYLPDAAWLLSRRIGPEGAFGFAAKGGNNAEPHNHNDLGQFILLGEGTVYLSDLGCGEYTADYFGAARYTYDCNGSQGHSVPIIDGQYQRPGADAYAEVLEAAAGGGADVLKLDLTRAYGHVPLERLTRSFRWHGEGELPVLELIDEFRFGGVPETLTERFVTFCRPVLEEGSIVLEGKDGRRLRICSGGGPLNAEITEHTYNDHFGAVKTWYGLDYHALGKLDKQARYEFKFQFMNL